MLDEQRNESFLLLTSTPREGGGIGSLYLQSLINGVPEVSMDWHTEPPFLLGQSLARFGKPGAALRSLVVRMPLWSAWRLALYRRFFAPRRLGALVGDETAVKSAPTILLTTSSPELITLGSRLVACGHDVLPIVWDAPNYLTVNLRLGRSATARVEGEFSALMKGARAVAVVSDEMKASYEQRYGVPCHIIRHGTAAVQRRDRSRTVDALRIVFAGSLYSKLEWNAFVAALELADWRLAGRDVRLVFIGNFPLSGATRPDRMECMPPVPHERALELMAEMDIGYLPYWFDAAHESVVRSSFPGKMTAYAAAGLAVFHHGPAYSTVTRFLEKYPMGVSCGSLNPPQILGQLNVLSNMILESATNHARRRAMEDALSSEAMCSAFRAMLRCKVNTRSVDARCQPKSELAG